VPARILKLNEIYYIHIIAWPENCKTQCYSSYRTDIQLKTLVAIIVSLARTRACEWSLQNQSNELLRLARCYKLMLVCPFRRFQCVILVPTDNLKPVSKPSTKTTPQPPDSISKVSIIEDHVQINEPNIDHRVYRSELVRIADPAFDYRDIPSKSRS
jgi:hypothetical protein